MNDKKKSDQDRFFTKLTLKQDSLQIQDVRPILTCNPEANYSPIPVNLTHCTVNVTTPDTLL
jgi:hypothetical protein